jgi:hypothetical protein
VKSPQYALTVLAVTSTPAMGEPESERMRTSVPPGAPETVQSVVALVEAFEVFELEEEGPNVVVVSEKVEPHTPTVGQLLVVVPFCRNPR